MKNRRTYKIAKDGFRKHPIQAKLHGMMNWELFHENFKLECWSHEKHGIVIIQFWPDKEGESDGWNDYTSSISEVKVQNIKERVEELEKYTKDNGGSFNREGEWIANREVDGQAMRVIHIVKNFLEEL